MAPNSSGGSMGTVTAFEIKFEGVPCQEMGESGCKQCKILDCTACRYNQQQESVLRKRGRSEH